MKRLLLIGALALTAGAQAFDLTIDNIMRGPGLVGYTQDDVRWSPDGSKVYFTWKQYSDPLQKERDTYVVNRDGSGLRKLSDEEKKDAPPANGDRTRDKRSVVFTDEGDIYIWEAATSRRRALTQTTESESAPHFTFDEQRVTFLRGNNLFSISRDGSIVQLTNIAGPDDKGSNVTMWDDKKGNESQEFIKAEERKLLAIIDERAKKREADEAKWKKEHPLKPFKLARGQRVSDARLTADGKYVIVTVAADAEKVKRTIVPNYVTESAYTEDIPAREKVGDAQGSSRIAILNAANGESKWFEHGLKIATPEPATAKTEKTDEVQRETAKPKDRDVYSASPVWSEDGKRAFVFVRSSDNKDAWIFAFDPATAKGRQIASMHDDAWVRTFGVPGPGWMGDNETIWYGSEATGFMHLYAVPYGGGTPRALTTGKFEVDSAVLSNDKKTFYLTTSEGSPYERHLWSMPATGGPRKQWTSTPGAHEAVVSPDGAAFADVHSYVNRPPELFLGTRRVTTSPDPQFATHPWLDVPIVEVPARDGARVPARIYKPANYAPGGKAVIFVHGAGYLQNVHHWWSSYYREYMFHHILLARGYLVLDIDYRASRGYGRDWRTAIYRHMGGKDLDDHIDAARWLVREHGIDAKKIGIYGGSYGGFITLMALFTQPDVFAAGAALRPVTDWAHYNHPYTSGILNIPQSDAEAFRRSSPIYFAEGLKGRLLICHGMVDTNVHYQDSVRLAQRLIELRKENWELASYPVENHAFVEPASWADEYKRIYKLFEETLR